ncbi:hypothetical protein BSNK01_04400 [Bacillaceae bacterium]
MLPVPIKPTFIIIPPMYVHAKKVPYLNKYVCLRHFSTAIEGLLTDFRMTVFAVDVRFAGGKAVVFS